MKKLIATILLIASSLLAVDVNVVTVPVGVDPNSIWTTGITNYSTNVFLGGLTIVTNGAPDSNRIVGVTQWTLPSGNMGLIPRRGPVRALWPA